MLILVLFFILNFYNYGAVNKLSVDANITQLIILWGSNLINKATIVSHTGS